MKVVIVSPPKSGANRLRCLLATLYGLRAVDSRDAPVGETLGDVAMWLDAIPDGCVMHIDPEISPDLVSSMTTSDVPFIAIVRHPFDLYISNREVMTHRGRRAQRRSRGGNSAEREPHERWPADSEYSLETLAADVRSLLDWSSRAAASVRYEDILECPEATLTRLTGVLGNRDAATVTRAIQLCPAEPRIASSGARGVRMSEIAPGSWRTRIDAATLDLLQGQFQDAIDRLGYEQTSTS